MVSECLRWHDGLHFFLNLGAAPPDPCRSSLDGELRHLARGLVKRSSLRSLHAMTRPNTARAAARQRLANLTKLHFNYGYLT